MIFGNKRLGSSIVGWKKKDENLFEWLKTYVIMIVSVYLYWTNNKQNLVCVRKAVPGINLLGKHMDLPNFLLDFEQLLTSKLDAVKCRIFVIKYKKENNPDETGASFSCNMCRYDNIATIQYVEKFLDPEDSSVEFLDMAMRDSQPKGLCSRVLLTREEIIETNGAESVYFNPEIDLETSFPLFTKPITYLDKYDIGVLQIAFDKSQVLTQGLNKDHE